MESQVYAKHINARIAPKKVAPVMDIARGKMLREAKTALTFDGSKASKLVLKVVESAHANAVNNNKLDENKLYISEIWVSPGKMVKTGRPKARGRFGRILKRSSHIFVGLSEVARKGNK